MEGISMREILFRAKRIDDSEWVEGYYAMMGKGNLIRHYIVQNCALTGLFEDPEDNMYFNDVEIDPETLCQYTGLKDKNGNRIWENDIVEDKRFNGFYKIVFRVRDGGWYVENINSGALFRIIERTSCQYERCGNIFDNPELLKGGLTYRN